MVSVKPALGAPAKENKAKEYLRRMWGAKIRVGKPWGPQALPSALSPPRLQSAAAAAAVNQLTPASTAVTFAATVAKVRGRKILTISQNAVPKPALKETALLPWRPKG
jgi:hypothetical protein